MFFEELIPRPDGGEVGPLPNRNGPLVQVVDPSSLHSQKDGGMGGQNDLTAKEPGGVLQKLSQFPLALDGEAVLRLVQQVKGILLNLIGEIPKGSLPVGPSPESSRIHL